MPINFLSCSSLNCPKENLGQLSLNEKLLACERDLKLSQGIAEQSITFSLEEANFKPVLGLTRSISTVAEALIFLKSLMCNN